MNLPTFKTSLTMYKIITRHFLFALFFQLCCSSLSFCQTTTADMATTTLLELSDQRTTTILFPAAICKNGVDRGSALVEARTVDGIANVLKVKAASDTLRNTNLTVYTNDGRVYRFEVTFAAVPYTDFFDFSDLGGEAASSGLQFHFSRMNDATIARATNQLTSMVPHRSRPRSARRGGIQLRTQGVYISDGVLFFQLLATNGSGIPFELDFARCYQRDRRRSKRTSQMEMEVMPLQASFNNGATVAAHDPHHPLVLAFEKFTIADSKYFMIELFEKNGDRHLVLRIKGTDILGAKPLLVSR